MTDSAESVSPWLQLASVRVNGSGYDIYRHTETGNFFTREIRPGAVSAGHHDNAAALALLAELARLAKTVYG